MEYDVKGGELVFGETVFDAKFLEHGCDDSVVLVKYPLDRPFGTMRRDLHFERKKDYEATVHERIGWYLEDRHTVSTYNLALRKHMRHHRVIEFYKLLEAFHVLKFVQTRRVKVPESFTIPIYDACFLYNDGNEKSVLVSDNRSYYLLKWAGS